MTRIANAGMKLPSAETCGTNLANMTNPDLNSSLVLISGNRDADRASPCHQFSSFLFDPAAPRLLGPFFVIFGALLLCYLHGSRGTGYLISTGMLWAPLLLKTVEENFTQRARKHHTASSAISETCPQLATRLKTSTEARTERVVFQRASSLPTSGSSFQ